jgi:hypothetical protein
MWDWLVKTAGGPAIIVMPRFKPVDATDLSAVVAHDAGAIS